jgi:PAS domain S-box-containing protein
LSDTDFTVIRRLASYSKSIWLTLFLAACCAATAFWLLNATVHGNRDVHRNTALASTLGRLATVVSSAGTDAPKQFRAIESALDRNAPAWASVQADVANGSEAMARVTELRRSLQDATGESERKHLLWAVDEEQARAADSLQAAISRVRQIQLQLAGDLFSRTRLLMAMAVLLSGMVILVGYQLRMHYISAGRHREVETALRTSEARFRELFQSVPIGVYQTQRDGSILAANEALVRMLGYETEAELRSVRAGEAYSDPSIRQHYMAQLEGDGCLRNIELDLRRKDGAAITVLENARTVRSESGDLLYYEGTMTDITHLKRIERELEAARDEAIAGSRLKSEFLANVSHEIRTPMAGVIGMANLLLETPLTGEQREYADAVRRSAEYLLGIIDDILDFSRTEAGRLAIDQLEFALSPCIEDVVEMFAEEADGRGLELACDIADDAPEFVRGDPKRLRQVITNLVGNAIKFTEAGQVLIRVGVVAHEPEHVLLRIAVCDTGIGITHEQMERIFEPFCQGDGSTTRKYGGTGLGLSISRRLVELMGGEITVSSDPGRGSTFTFDVRLGVQAAPVPPMRDTELCGAMLYLAGIGGIRRDLITQHATAWGMNVTAVRDLTEVASGGILLADPGTLTACPAAPCQLFVLRHFARQARASDTQVSGIAGVITVPVRFRRLRAEFARALASPRTAAAARNRILIAEDNAVNQTIARRLVEKLGYEATVVPSGAEAVQAALTGLYELVLMDCQMPSMDGFAATAEIRAREQGSRLPVIAMTANVLEGDRDRCLAAGMDDYITKPVDAEELAAVVRRWTSPVREEKFGAAAV